MRLPSGRFSNAVWVSALIAWRCHSVPPAGGVENVTITNRQPRVLILYSNERLLPANIVADEVIRSTFKTGFPKPVEFYSEFLDVDRFPGEVQQEHTRDFFTDKYQKRPPDLIIAGGGSAFRFLMKYRATMFTRIPVVHCALSPGEIPDFPPDDQIAGIPLTLSPLATLDLALRLHPDTRKVVLVGGIRGDILELEHGMSRLDERVGLIWLTNRSLPELRGELSRLSKHTVVLYGVLFQDGDGNRFTPREALTRFAPSCPVPIYGYYETYLGHGIVGGSMVSFETVGRSAAEIAVRILSGEQPNQASLGATNAPSPMVDWNQLRRWNISESRLPPGSVVLFRPPSFWEEYWAYVAFGSLIIFVQAVTIGALFLQWTRSRRAEAFVRDLGGRLIHAQEVERHRIARDLHDDLSQRLALLAVELEMFGQKPSADRDTIAGRLQGFSTEVKGLSSEVHRLAHELHPAKLEQLGLAAAVRGFCHELSSAHTFFIEFEPRGVPRVLPNEVALCLYRVTQEALQNVVKHSGATSAKVALVADGTEIQLTITDDGHGFDPGATGARGSLGIVSMHERVRMVQGEIDIHSQPGGGTRIEARIPLKSEVANL